MRSNVDQKACQASMQEKVLVPPNDAGLEYHVYVIYFLGLMRWTLTVTDAFTA